MNITPTKLRILRNIAKGKRDPFDGMQTGPRIRAELAEAGYILIRMDHIGTTYHLTPKSLAEIERRDEGVSNV